MAWMALVLLCLGMAREAQNLLWLMAWIARALLCLVMAAEDLTLRLVAWKALTLLSLEIAREVLAFAGLVMA